MLTGENVQKLLIPEYDNLEGMKKKPPQHASMP
jgi:hypothetical protein